MSHGKVITVSISAFFTLAIGCQTPSGKQAEERNEARKEIKEASVQAAKKIEEATDDLDEAEKKFGEKVSDAHENVAKEVVEAQREIAAADVNAAKELAGDRYERFEILKNESEAAFATRAAAALTRLQTDLDAAKLRAKAATSEDLAKDLDVAATAIAEANKDLVELRAKTGKVFDDGRIGVGTAINQAQRNLADAYQEIAALRM